MKYGGLVNREEGGAHSREMELGEHRLEESSHNSFKSPVMGQICSSEDTLEGGRRES